MDSTEQLKNTITEIKSISQQAGKLGNALSTMAPPSVSKKSRSFEYLIAVSQALDQIVQQLEELRT